MASPFNRPNQGPFRGQPPPSFKTNVNRNKTKKWLEAKGASYDGDDWGEYDETDEYGVEQEHPEQMPPLSQQAQQRVTGLRQAGQSAGVPPSAGRNFTDPRGAPPQGIQRQQSFDVGDERRAFSAGTAAPPLPGQHPHMAQGAPLHVDTEAPPAMRNRADTSSSHYPSAGGLASSSDNTPYSANPTHRRDFEPSAMPPPLHSAGGTDNPLPPVDTSSASEVRPPRKSSLSQPTSPLATDLQAPVEEDTPRQRAPSNPTKPLPFIRPADIYKRMEEERARERASSQDSSRPSLDSLLRPNEELRGTPSKKSSCEGLRSVQEERTGTPASQKKPTLPTVAESQPAAARAFLPPSETSPSFSDEFQHFTSPQSRQPPAEQQADLQHQPSFGFRSVVEQAFDRPGEAKSETSGSGEGLRSPGQSDISRSNTDSTAGISPIMSRVPSVGAAAAARTSFQQHDSFDHSTPTIAEEPAGSSRPTSLEGIPAASTPKKPSLAHSREPSAESAFIPGYRRQDTPPSRGSPARTAAVEQSRRTPEPHAAYVAAPTPTLDHPVSSNPEMPFAAQQESARPQSPAKSRSQSPSKNRVSQLAGRFDDIAEANSRRNSSHSLASRQSWEADSRKSWTGGPEQLQTEPALPSQADLDLRPKLPGQWESFATNRTDSEPAAPGNTETLPADSAAEKSTLRSNDVQNETPSIVQNPVAALTAAGAAIGESLRSSIIGSSDEPKGAQDDKADYDEGVRGEPGRLAVGEIVSRPGALRTQSALSNTSTVPPTPPPKDDDPFKLAGGASHGNGIQPPLPLKSHEPAHTEKQEVIDRNLLRVDSELDADRAFDDEENERLHKDIVRSLSPEKDRHDDQTAPGDIPGNRESNILPSEYGDYWEGATPDGTRYSRMPGDVSVGPQGVELTRPENIPEETSPVQKEAPSRPGFLDNRFSWEQNRDSIGFSQFTGLGATSDTAPTALPSTVPGHQHRPSDGSDAPEVVQHEPEPVPEPSATVDDLPRRSAERSMSPPGGLHIVNVRGAEEAVDMPPRLKTPEPPSESHTSREGASPGITTASQDERALTEQEPLPVDEKDFAAPSQSHADPAPAPSLAPAAEVYSPAADASKPRIPPFRELAAIPNPRDRIKAYDSTRAQFATTDTGLQGWISQTIATYPEHSHLLKGGQPFPINTGAAAAGARPGHRASPSMSKFTNILSPNSPQQSQNLDTARPAPGSSPSASQPSAGGSIGAQKGKELLQNAGVLGGKVGQGAKGLFAKGRNKLRAASGTDKVSAPIATAAAAKSTPSPASSQTLSRASTQPIEPSRSIEQPTPTRPRSSVFRRFSSRPSSMAVSEADNPPDAPPESLPPTSRHSTPDNRSTASGLSVSKRRMSPFPRRSSRPSSAVTVDSMAAVPEIPQEPLPTHQRSATFGGMLMQTRSRDDEDRGKLKGLRRLSAFRRGSRPDSVALPDKSAEETVFPGGYPKGLTYTGDRRASYAFGSTLPMTLPTAAEQRRASLAVNAARSALPPQPDIFGGPEKLQETKDGRPPSQLGILPSPTKDSFGLAQGEPPSPGDDDDSTPRATQFNPNQTALDDHLAAFVPSPTDAEPELEAPQRRDTSKSLTEENEARQSRLIESIVRHASPPLKDIESRRQSRVGIEPDTAHLPLPNMGTVSGAPSPGTEKSDPLANKTPPSARQISPPVLPKVEIPKSYSVKEGKMPAREEVVPSPEPPLPPAGAGVIPTSPLDGKDASRALPSVDRNLSVASKTSDPVSALEPSPELDGAENRDGGPSVLVSREISSASLRPVSRGSRASKQGAPVSREDSQVSKEARPDVSPISDEDQDARATIGPVQPVTYGERKAGWLDDSDEGDTETPIEQAQPRVPSTVPVPYGQMDKEITIEPLSRTSTEEDNWDRVSREEASRGDGAETREGWHTPTEDLDNDDEEVEINEAGTASSGHVRQISDIAKLNRESLRLKAEAVAAARASAIQEPLPNGQHLVDQAQQTPVPVTPQLGSVMGDTANTGQQQATIRVEEEDLPPPVPPKSPGPAVPARQSPFSERASALTPPQESKVQGHLQRPSFGAERPLSFQMLPRPVSGSVPQEQINVSQPQAPAPRQSSPLVSPPRIRPPIPQPRDYSQPQDMAQTPISPDGDSPRGMGLRRTSGPVQPPPPSQHVRQKSIDRLSQPVQSASTDPQNTPTVSRSVDPRMFQGQSPARQAIDPRQYTGTEFQSPGAGPLPPQTRDPRALPVGFLKGMSKQPSPGPSEQQQQSTRIDPRATSPQYPQMPSYQPTGPPEERRPRKPGFFGGLRPSSSGAETVLTADSTRAQPATSPTTKIHYLSDIERQKSEAAASGKLSKSDKRIERAQSSGELTGGKKKRFSSLTGLFGRSGTTGHAPPSRASGSGRKLQKINEQKTPSPAQGQAVATPPGSQPYPQQQDSRSPPFQPSSSAWNPPTSAYQAQTGEPATGQVNIPPGGFYAPENNGFMHGQGPNDFSAVTQQAGNSYSYGQGQPTLPNVEESRALTYMNGGQHSPPPHRWRHPDSSLPVGGAALDPSPARHMSAGLIGMSGQSPAQSGVPYGAPNAYGPSPPPARHASAPSHSEAYGRLRPQHAPRMPSVGEDGRHQERPWALQLPQGPPDPENDAHRRDSIQYAMMVRQQMAQQQTVLEQRSPQSAYQAQQVQYYPPPQSRSFAGHAQAPYDMPTYPTAGGHHPQGRYSEIRDSQAPVLTLDPAAIARIKLEAQERTRQRDIEVQRLQQQQQQEEEEMQQRRPYTAPDDENSLYAPPTRPQTALSPQQTPPPPLPAQYAYPPPQQPNPQQSAGYDTQAYAQRAYQQYTGREAVPNATEPHHYPLPTSPTDTVGSPINPMAGQMSPPPLPAPQPSQQPPDDPDSKAVGFGAHRNYPSASSIAAPPPPYRRSRVSADERMDVPTQTLLQTERRTEELRSQIEARRRQGQQHPQEGRRRPDDDEPVVMHAASYPGMEWEPRWDEY